MAGLLSRIRGRPVSALQLGSLVTETAHGVTGVASLILLADIGDERFRALHFTLSAAINASSTSTTTVRFALNFKADRKLHLCLPLSMLKNVAQLNCEVELLGPVRFSIPRT